MDSTDLRANPEPQIPGERSYPHSFRVPAIDALRGAAALAVLIHHAPVYRGPLGQTVSPWLYPLDFVHHGVTLFIVISGFCIHLASIKGSTSSLKILPDWGRFWFRRFARLYPTYIIALAFSAGVWLAVRGSLGEPDAVVADVLCHLLMIHNLTNYCCAGYNGAFWTLGLEEQLYALYALFLIVRNRASLRIAAIAVFCVTIAWRAGVPLLSAVATNYLGIQYVDQSIHFGPVQLRVSDTPFWPFAWWFAWILGAIAAEAYVGLVRLPSWSVHLVTGCCLLALAVALEFPSFFDLPLTSSSIAWKLFRYCISPLSGMCWAGAAFVIVCRSTFGPLPFANNKIWKLIESPFKKLGYISYSLYLVHNPVISIVENTLSNIGIELTLLGRYMVMLPSAILFAVVFYYLFERPFLAWSKSISNSHRASRV